MSFILGTILALVALRLMTVTTRQLATGPYFGWLMKTIENRTVVTLVSLGFGLTIAALTAASPSAIRYKMILGFVLSLLLAIIGIESLLVVAYWLSAVPFFEDLLRLVRDTAGAVSVVTVAGVVLFVLVFFALSASTIGFIEQLNRAIHRIAQGDFAAPVPERSPDELGQLAGNLSAMAARLQAVLEQERNAERTKYDLITSVSHDLRTPLTSILGYLELADDDKYADEVELRHYVAIAHAKCRQLQRMIEQLFEFTRTSHGALQIARRQVNLAELLEQLAEEFVPQLQSIGVDYRLQLPVEKVIVSADPDLLVRVFENLISNAIRYGQAGGSVDLELERDANQAVVRVVNHGEPIPEPDLPHLFESFYRVEKSRSAATGGAGLGLAIARNVVGLHDGTITAHNEPNRRTVFEVRLPLPSTVIERG